MGLTQWCHGNSSELKTFIAVKYAWKDSCHCMCWSPFPCPPGVFFRNDISGWLGALTEAEALMTPTHASSTCSWGRGGRWKAQAMSRRSQIQALHSFAVRPPPHWLALNPHLPSAPRRALSASRKRYRPLKKQLGLHWCFKALIMNQLSAVCSWLSWPFSLYTTQLLRTWTHFFL